jgi:valyl-tRNA synthetase
MQMHADKAEFSASDSAAFNAHDFDQALMSPDDKYILHGLQKAIADCEDNLEKFRFNDSAAVLYEFIWHQYCDWYVEYAKTVLYGDDDAKRTNILKIMYYVLSNSLRLLHPFMPFITEELWHAMGYAGDDDSIVLSAWPEKVSKELLDEWGVTNSMVEYVGQKYEIIRAGRTLRADYGLPPSKKLAYAVKPATQEAGELLSSDKESAMALLRAESLTVDADYEPPKATPSGITKLGTVYMPVEGLIDVEAEIEKLSKQKAKVNDDLARINAKLENLSFVEKAPKKVVDKQREFKADLIEKNDKLKRLLEALMGE